MSGGDCAVSVVIATCRREALVLEAIASALAQGVPSLEVVVVDDSPTASARAAVEGLRDERVRYFARAEPSGGKPSLVRNDGVSRARGALIQFLDDDDRLAPGAVQALQEALAAAPRAGMAFGRIAPFGDDAQMLARERAYFERVGGVARALRGDRRAFARQMLFADTLLVNSACMIRRPVFERAGGYDTALTLCEDVDFFLRVGREHGFAFVDRPTLEYRVGAPSLTRDAKAGAHDPRVDFAYHAMRDKHRRAHPAEHFAFRVQNKLERVWRRLRG